MVFCSSAVKKWGKLKTVSKWKNPGMFNSENVEVNGFKISRPHKDNIFFQMSPLLKMIANESVTLHN